MRRFFAAAAMVVMAGHGWAQTTGIATERPAEMIQGDMKRAMEMLSSPATPQEWQPVNPAASVDEVVDELSQAGWDAATTRRALSGSVQYDLLSRTPAPGIKSFIAVPRDGSGAAVEFSPPVADGMIQPAFFGGMTAEDIRREIIDGMQAAIDDLCAMRARPSTIRVQVSAVGAVEFEGTWNASEVCAP